MANANIKRQNFDITAEQESEIAWLKEMLDAPSAKDTLLRAVRITSILTREIRGGAQVLLRTRTGETERLIIPEVERPAASEWRYLVQREHPWRRQMSVKGRRLLAATVWRDMQVNQQTPEEAAKDWDLPPDAIDEIVRWCEANRSLIEMEAEEEANLLRTPAQGSR